KFKLLLSMVSVTAHFPLNVLEVRAMESNEQVNKAPGTADNTSEAGKGEKTRRRSVRGRRSSIRVEVEGSSPVVVAAPLSESIMQNTVVDKVALLAQRKDQIIGYTERLRSEKEEWNQLLERQRMKTQHEESKVDRAIERKSSARVPIENLGQNESIQKPRYALNRVLRAFNKQNEGFQNQKAVDELRAECESVSSSIDVLKAKTKACIALLNAEPKEELLARKKWLEDLISREASRMRWVEERLARLEVQESYFNEKHGISGN
ncbi:hypothetical protein V3C99_003362, partial [Haemonchus contortus]|uniref:NAM-associated domain-containing protein n=1 Tax=Haemonchus contortus TaxID=6289 RepID=A0A7I4Y041_HAECO